MKTSRVLGVIAASTASTGKPYPGAVSTRTTTPSAASAANGEHLERRLDDESLEGAGARRHRRSERPRAIRRRVQAVVEPVREQEPRGIDVEVPGAGGNRPVVVRVLRDVIPRERAERREHGGGAPGRVFVHVQAERPFHGQNVRRATHSRMSESTAT